MSVFLYLGMLTHGHLDRVYSSTFRHEHLNCVPLIIILLLIITFKGKFQEDLNIILRHLAPELYTLATNKNAV